MYVQVFRRTALLTSLPISFEHSAAKQIVVLNLVSVRTVHLHAIAPRLIGSDHQTDGFQGLLDHRQLTLVKREIENLPRFCFLLRRVSLDIPLEFLLGEYLGFVHTVNSYTLELLCSFRATFASSFAFVQLIFRSSCFGTCVRLMRQVVIVYPPDANPQPLAFSGRVFLRLNVHVVDANRIYCPFRARGLPAPEFSL